MIGWRNTSIGFVCGHAPQRDPRVHPSLEFKYVDIAAVDRDAKQITKYLCLNGSQAPSRARKEIEAGDVLVSTVRPNLNAVAVVPAELDSQIASTGFCVLRPDPKCIDSRYLYYFVQTPEFVAYLVSHARGAHYPAVSEDVVKRARIPLPALSEQRQIVKILDQAHHVRRKRFDANAKAERIPAALFFNMFGDPATKGHRLRQRSLGSLIKVRDGNLLPASAMDPSGQYPVYGGNGIAGRHSQYMFENRMVVIGRVGVYCGVVHYADPHCWVTDNALVVSDHSPEVIEEYLVYALRFALLNQYAGRAGQPLISAERICPVSILVPEIEDQQRFAKLVKIVETSRALQEEQGIRLERLFCIIIHRAFSGELTARWREAHSNELLAEMEQQSNELRRNMGEVTGDARL